MKKIIVSGLITPNEKEKLDGCADVCLEKPFDIDVLLRVVREKLGP
jgi:hypothetical protein